MTEKQLFAALGEELQADAERSLSPLRLPPFEPSVGPYLTVQYVIELVGRDPIPSAAAKELLSPPAQRSLGQPEVFVMSPLDRRWKVLWQGEEAAAFDSLALAWDLVTPGGKISEASAKTLWERSEQVAFRLNRKAVPMPAPEDAARRAAALEEFRDAMDVGVDLAIIKAGGLSTDVVVKTAYALGYRLGASQLLEYRQSGWPEALLAVFPLGNATAFDPSCHEKLEGVGVGYQVAASPDPEGALRAALHTAKELARACSATVFLEEGEPLTPAGEQMLFQNLSAALDTFEQAGIEPGSPEALRLFTP
ncbi:MAG: hypothetical protein C4341_05320 [Armatimonadota bacterium]